MRYYGNKKLFGSVLEAYMMGVGKLFDEGVERSIWVKSFGGGGGQGNVKVKRAFGMTRKRICG